MSYDYTANNTKLDAFLSFLSVDSSETEFMFLSWSLFCQIFDTKFFLCIFVEQSVNEGNRKERKILTVIKVHRMHQTEYVYRHRKSHDDDRKNFFLTSSLSTAGKSDSWELQKELLANSIKVSII